MTAFKLSCGKDSSSLSHLSKQQKNNVKNDSSVTYYDKLRTREGRLKKDRSVIFDFQCIEKC
jgi:hypothetical protein